jgi:hypothetical protein
MINICGSNLIPIFITLLCCGAIFVYFNSRLNEIKFAVEKQNRVLTAFITNVQQDIRSGGCMENLAAPEAVLAAKKFVLEKEKENQKIVVSDDEDESDSDDSSSDSEDSDESEDGDVGRDEIEIDQLPPIAFEVLSISDIYGASASEAGAGASDAGARDAGASDAATEGAGASEADTSIIEVMDDSLNLVNLLNVGTDATKSESYDQMRVDDLRKIVSDKNLATKDDVKRLKKPELLVLLKK